MKRLLISILILTLFVSFIRNEQKLIVQARINNIRDTIWDSVQRRLYDIKLSLINNSSDTINFWTMSCDWTRNWTIEPNGYYLEGMDCDLNTPRKFHINPYDSVTYRHLLIKNCFTYRHLLIKNKVDSNNEITKIKFGFILIDTTVGYVFKQNPDYSSGFFKMLVDKRKQGDVIWSNPINIEKHK